MTQPECETTAFMRVNLDAKDYIEMQTIIIYIFFNLVFLISLLFHAFLHPYPRNTIHIYRKCTFLNSLTPNPSGKLRHCVPLCPDNVFILCSVTLAYFV